MSTISNDTITDRTVKNQFIEFRLKNTNFEDDLVAHRAPTLRFGDSNFFPLKSSLLFVPIVTTMFANIHTINTITRFVKQ